ncbi:MAG: hypothetical protein PHQ18_00320, partial [Patescibacteria group bacterium]|nr:hypothetical protein [Patescibacteria group bacterium]
RVKALCDIAFGNFDLRKWEKTEHPDSSSMQKWYDGLSDEEKEMTLVVPPLLLERIQKSVKVLVHQPEGITDMEVIEGKIPASVSESSIYTTYKYKN